MITPSVRINGTAKLWESSMNHYSFVAEEILSWLFSLSASLPGTYLSKLGMRWQYMHAYRHNSLLSFYPQWCIVKQSTVYLGKSRGLWLWQVACALYIHLCPYNKYESLPTHLLDLYANLVSEKNSKEKKPEPSEMILIWTAYRFTSAQGLPDALSCTRCSQLWNRD